MGQDHNLTNLYANMLAGSAAPAKTQAPRTLKEAYERKLVTEKTGFYAIDMKSGTQQPVYSGLKSLGVLDDEDARHIKSTILSNTILDTSKALLKQGGWSAEEPVVKPRVLGSWIFYNEINLKDVDNILLHKKDLTAIMPEKNTGEFNLLDKVCEGIDGISDGEAHTDKQHFKNMFKKIVAKRGKIGGTDVGPGEILLSLFTCGRKSEKKGDLIFGDTPVEIKDGTSGAALGRAIPEQPSNIQKAIKDISSEGYSVNKPFLQTKAKFQRFAETLKDTSVISPGLPPTLTEKFFAALDQLSPLIVSGDATSFTNYVRQHLYIDLTKSYREANTRELLSVYEQKGYIDSLQANRTPESIRFFYELLLVGKTTGEEPSVRQKLKNVSDELQRKGGSSPGSSVGESSLTSQFKDLFLWSNHQATDEQLASVLFAARPNKDAAPGLEEDILKALDPDRGGYSTSLKKHDAKALDGLMFAIHVSEYARKEEFDYILVFNRSTYKALYIPARKGFTEMLNFYREYGGDLINLKIVLGNRQGVHSLSID